MSLYHWKITPNKASFIQGQTLISAKALHGGYPW